MANVAIDAPIISSQADAPGAFASSRLMPLELRRLEALRDKAVIMNLHPSFAGKALSVKNRSSSIGYFEQGELLSLLRTALDQVLSDQRFLEQTSVSAIELSEHILQRANGGERNLTRLIDTAFQRLNR